MYVFVEDIFNKSRWPSQKLKDQEKHPFFKVHFFTPIVNLFHVHLFVKQSRINTKVQEGEWYSSGHSAIYTPYLHLMRRILL